MPLDVFIISFFILYIRRCYHLCEGCFTFETWEANWIVSVREMVNTDYNED